MNLSSSTWTHYLYRILFEDGRYYIGVSKRRNDDPTKDNYYGSPVTHKEKWKTPHTKQILAFLWCQSRSEACKIERQLFSKLCLKDDCMCLNGLIFEGRKKKRNLSFFLRSHLNRAF